ncbi:MULTISPECIES: hypothetical protein [Neisseria]|nr:MULTISPECIES: hypothetical protein [Neisseria]
MDDIFTRNQDFADALEAAVYLEPETDETKPDYSPVGAIYKY